MQRRKFLQYAAASGLGLLGSGFLYKYLSGADPDNFLGTAVSRPAERYTPLLIPSHSGALGVLDITDEPLILNARATTLPLIHGKASPFLLYAAQYANKDFQNPIIRIQRGKQFHARLQNDLSEPTIIHWHGLHVPGIMDGQPRATIAAGEHFDYTFPVTNRSGMYWYHTHAHQLTAKQAYFGLAGMFMVEDDDDLALRTALQLEPGITELPLLIQDKQFNSSGKLSYGRNPMQQMMGQLGDTILVNLTPHAQLDISNRVYRFRVLNGSNSRIYKLAFVHNGKALPFSIIGTDAGLLERPYSVQAVFLAPAERLDILFDARQLQPNDEILLKSLAFEAMNNEMMGGMGGMSGGMGGMMGGMGGSSLALGVEFEIMKLVLTLPVKASTTPLPSRLSSIPRIKTTGAAVRNIHLAMQGMGWAINGETFNMDSYPLQTRSNAIELWDIRNAAMSMPHPMHLHGYSFQIVSRTNSPRQVSELAQDKDGRMVTDLGWKDTILVWPGETVRIAIDFSNSFGGDQIYLFHCHNLEHEDQGMMVNLLVKAV